MKLEDMGPFAATALIALMRDHPSWCDAAGKPDPDCSAALGRALDDGLALLVKRNGKEYLALGLDSSAQVAIVDVSDSRRPHALDSAAPAPGKPGAEINVLADNLSLFGKSDAAAPASPDPKELRSFSGVTAFVIDAAHGLIYATNNDGLWIVKTSRQAADDARADNYGG